MTITPAQLVDLLVTFPLDPSRRVDQDQPLEDAFSEVLTLSEDAVNAFFEESAALYFRQILEVFNCSDVAEDHGLVAAVYQAHWLRSCLNTAAGARFVREFPVEAGQLSDFVLEQISHLPDDVFTDDLANQNLLPDVSLFISSVSSQSWPGAGIIVQRSSSTQEILLKRVPFIQHLVKDRPFPLASHQLASLSTLSDVISNGTKSSVTVEKDIEDKVLLAWRPCELIRDGKNREVEEGTVRCDEGIEMMACGRCLAVRYCCREHQKAHWKRHKLFCFKPACHQRPHYASRRYFPPFTTTYDHSLTEHSQ